MDKFLCQFLRIHDIIKLLFFTIIYEEWELTLDKKIGIIDLGSNSVRLVIFEIKRNGAFRLIDDISDTIRLSENMLEGKYINDLSMRRALKTIKLFKKLCGAYKIQAKDLIAFATAAVRKAENREYFLKLLLNATGINFRLLSGEEEASYIYNAVIHTVDVDEGIIIDVGGGSSEIIKFKNREIVNSVCIPIGAVVATETFDDKDNISHESINQLEKKIKALLASYDWLKENKNPIVIGLGGTIRNLAKIHRSRVGYPLNLSHNYIVNVSDFFKIYDELKIMNIDARKKVEGLSSNRADIIIGGLTVLKALFSIVSSQSLIISGYGLREGVLFEYIFKNKQNVIFTDVLSFSINNTIELFGIREGHANHVATLATFMFDQLAPLHMMGDEERKLLRVAAIMHDIGISVSYYKHYLHSFYIILNARLNGLTHREIVLIAAIAASHGKEKIKSDYISGYKSILNQKDNKIYQRLSLILKLAECLDRSETGIIKNLDCKITEDFVKVKTYKTGEAELELSLANENCEAFKKIFNKNLIIM